MEECNKFVGFCFRGSQFQQWSQPDGSSDPDGLLSLLLQKHQAINVWNNNYMRLLDPNVQFHLWVFFLNVALVIHKWALGGVLRRRGDTFQLWKMLVVKNHEWTHGPNESRASWQVIYFITCCTSLGLTIFHLCNMHVCYLRRVSYCQNHGIQLLNHKILKETQCHV